MEIYSLKNLCWFCSHIQIKVLKGHKVIQGQLSIHFKGYTHTPDLYHFLKLET